MLRSPTAVKGIALVASGMVHAAAFAAVAGHPNASGTLGVDRAVDVSLDPLFDEAPSAAVPGAEHDAMAPRPVTHTHSYPVPPSHDSTPHDPRLVHLRGTAAPAAPALAAAQPEAPPRFAMVVGGSPKLSGTVGSGEHLSEVASQEGEPMLGDRTTTPARLLSGSTPSYPPRARALGIEAKVVLEIVVDASGRVVASRVVRAAGMGFDEAALSAVGTYRFAPATLDGRAVRVRMPWAVEFRLD
jgi:protein TonB